MDRMDHERKVIGYTLEPIYEKPPGSITTHAFIVCANCGAVVSGNGGPVHNAICLKCADHLSLIGELK